MANSSTDSSATDGTSAAAAKPATESYAVNEAVEYISQLLTRRNKKQVQLGQAQGDLASAQDRQHRVERQTAEATQIHSQTEANLKAANDVGKKVAKVADYFRKQQTETSQLAKNARDMALYSFQAMQLLGREGLARLEEIQNSVSTWNATPANAQRQYTPIFTRKLQESQTLGGTALNGLHDAVEASFNAFVQSQTISSRSQQYRQRFEDLLSEIGKVAQRLAKEHSLAHKALNRLKSQQQVLETQVTVLQNTVDSLQLEYDLLDAEYNAAQQGASYAYQGA